MRQGSNSDSLGFPFYLVKWNNAINSRKLGVQKNVPSRSSLAQRCHYTEPHRSITYLSASGPVTDSVWKF